MKIVSVGCKVCRREHHILVPKAGYRLWARRAKHIQDAMPGLSDDDRELLLSGVCGRCFDRMFKED